MLPPEVFHARILNESVSINVMHSQTAAIAAGWSYRQSQKVQRRFLTIIASLLWW